MDLSSLPNKLFPNQKGFPTPNAAPDINACRVFSIPADEEWLALVMGAVGALTNEWAWYQNGALTPAEAAQAFTDVIATAYAQAEEGTCSPTVDTPYWDEEEDIEAEEPTDMQTWYGEVTNPTAPADELDFVENAIVWGFTGLIAIATVEIGAAPAILFATIAPKFVIAMKKADVGEIIRIVVDGKDAAKVDTSSYPADSIINIPVLTDPADSPPHTFMVMGLPT